MKVLIFNGSPRLNGNTRTALVALKEEIEHKMPDAETELIDADRKNVSGCVNCDACKHNGGECVQEDDTVEIIQKIYDAEILIFGSPVYWWGITAKLKLIIDKMYSKSEQLSKIKKKVGVICVGMAELTDPEYKLITDQFQCICDHLNWGMVFSEAFVSENPESLKKNKEKLTEIKELHRKFM